MADISNEWELFSDCVLSPGIVTQPVVLQSAFFAGGLAILTLITRFNQAVHNTEEQEAYLRGLREEIADKSQELLLAITQPIGSPT